MRYIPMASPHRPAPPLPYIYRSGGGYALYIRRGLHIGLGVPRDTSVIGARCEAVEALRIYRPDFH